MPKQYSGQPLLEFNPKLPKLSDNEQQVLKLLVEAGKLIVPIYQEQLSQVSSSEKEIKEAAEEDPSIISPFTVVEKVNDKLVATPYHIKYAELLKPIASKLMKAGSITENREFGEALKMQAKALLDGSYEQATVTWLKTEPYILDIAIGPINHFDDQVFFGKAFYQAWVGTLDKERTKKFNRYKTIALSASRKALTPKERIENLDQIKLKAIDVILFSGLIARTKVVGINLPMDDVNIVEKYGSEVTLFNQLNELRLKEQILPTFNKIFTLPFRQSFTKEDLKRGYLRAVVLHQLAHSYLYYRDSLKNLQDLFPCIYELTATVLGLRMTGSLLLQDVVSNKQLESMIVAFISRSYYLMEEKKVNQFMSNYALGSSIFINFMLESNALKRSQGLIVSNFTKIFVSLHDLYVILERLLAQGTRKDAEKFIRKYEELNLL